jgi:hypothetical protein
MPYLQAIGSGSPPKAGEGRVNENRTVYSDASATSYLTFNENLPLYIPAAKRSKNLGPWRQS